LNSRGVPVEHIVHAPGAQRTRKIRRVKEWLLDEARLAAPT